MSKLTVLKSEADALERGAEILAKSPFTGAGPAMEQLGRALELLLRKEAERTRYKLRSRESVTKLFPADEAIA